MNNAGRTAFSIDNYDEMPSIKRDAKPRGYPKSCIDESRWSRTVSQAPANRAKSKSVDLDAQGNPLVDIYLRRQENCVTKVERRIASETIGNIKTNPTIETKAITEDFYGNSMEFFDRRFDVSNEFICRDFILANNPKKKLASYLIARKETEYLESLEWYNLCRNCKQPIKTRKTLLNGERVFLGAESGNPDWKGACKIGVNKGTETIVAEIPEHFEVVYSALKDGLVLRTIEKRTVFNCKCECLFVDVRKKEYLEKPRKSRVL